MRAGARIAGVADGLRYKRTATQQLHPRESSTCVPSGFRGIAESPSQPIVGEERSKAKAASQMWALTGKYMRYSYVPGCRTIILRPLYLRFSAEQKAVDHRKQQGLPLRLSCVA